MNKIKSTFVVISEIIIKHKYIFSVLLLILFCTLAYFSFYRKTAAGFEVYEVVAGNLEESVSLTGTVKPSAEANLSFEKTGVLKSLNVKVGDLVMRGQTLAVLSSENEYARVLEAQANVASQKAMLEDLRSGAKKETIEIKKSAVEKANLDLAQAYRNAGDTVKNISISGNTFVRDNLANLFTGDKSQGYKINVNSCDSQTESKINLLKAEAETALSEIEKVSSNYSSLESDTDMQKAQMFAVKNTQMKKITDYLNSLKDLFSSGCSITNSSYDTTRTAVTTSRNTWSTLNTELSAKINLIDSLKIAKSQAEEDLRSAQSGEKSQKVKQQEAQVSAAVARLVSANADANKNVMSAPFGGIVTNVDLKIGELVTPGGKTLSLISATNFEIESKVSEVDVSKLSKGATAKVTFDTYGDDLKFDAIVSNISPAGIISEGVPTYKTVFSFLNKDEKIRSGMTANIEVVTKIHENIISIPAKYILNISGVKKVKSKINLETNKIVEKEVTTGARGTNGEVEILSGLEIGDVLVLEK